MDKNTFPFREAPSRPLIIAADEKTVSDPGTETETGSRAGTETGREKTRGSGRERGREGGRETESLIGHQISKWTPTLRYVTLSNQSVNQFEIKVEVNSHKNGNNLIYSNYMLN